MCNYDIVGRYNTAYASILDAEATFSEIREYLEKYLEEGQDNELQEVYGNIDRVGNLLAIVLSKIDPIN